MAAVLAGAGLLPVPGFANAAAPKAMPKAAQQRPPLPDTTDEAFNQECLAAHNSYRARHSAPPLTLDDAAVEHAKARAQAGSTRSGLAQPPEPETQGYAELRHWIATSEDEPVSCAEAVRLWYESRWTGGYDWNQPGHSPDTAPFTQVVWKSTTTLGCGRAAGRVPGEEGFQTYIVCGYAPPGNIIGKFRDNVGAPVS
ncbi:CAP family protein [Streptomyces sp. NPDC101110]|uniref:CAP family protein n=1 Tax=Streptomyces sp. NPDC101110 TaxID=3366104 RepID=UPI003826A332